MSRRRSRLTEVLDPYGFDDGGLVRELSAVSMGEAKLAAYQAGLVAAMAARRPASADRRPDEPGHRVDGWTPGSPPAGVSEFFADELAMIKGISPAAAQGLIERSLVLVRELTATWAALADGLIDVARANAIVKALGGQSTDAGGGGPGGGGRGGGAGAGVGAGGGDPAAVAGPGRRSLDRGGRGGGGPAAEAGRAGCGRAPRPAADGMAQLVADMPMPVAAACRDAVDGYARMAKADGDTRPIGQLRTEIMADLTGVGDRFVHLIGWSPCRRCWCNGDLPIGLCLRRPVSLPHPGLAHNRCQRLSRKSLYGMVHRI